MHTELILTQSDQIDAAFWLNAAHGAVRRECGWHVAPIVEETLVLDGSGGESLLLPSGRVVEILEATNAGEDVTADVDFSKSGVLELQCGRWASRLGQVTIRLRHGYAVEEVPEVASLIATLARRGGSAPGVVARQSVNGASVEYLTGGGAPLSIPLMQSEKDLLAPYRLVWEA